MQPQLQRTQKQALLIKQTVENVWYDGSQLYNISNSKAERLLLRLPERSLKFVDPTGQLLKLAVAGSPFW